MTTEYLCLAIMVMGLWLVPCIWAYAVYTLPDNQIAALVVVGEIVIAVIMAALAPPDLADPAPPVAPPGYVIDTVVPHAAPAPTCFWQNDSVQSVRFCPGGP
jgi:hypothetical protein